MNHSQILRRGTVFFWNMETLLTIFFFLATFTSWAASQVIPPLAIFPNVSYGSDPQQVMDVYLPGGRDTSVTKVIVTIHGGGWSAGSKEQMNGYVYWFYLTFPRYAIVNINYRLATVDSPAFPKQLEDIKQALQFITSKQVEYQIKPKFGLVGASAGAHLALLYGYAWDKSAQVDAICNIVGPVDLTDPAYTNIPVMIDIIKNLVGNYTYEQNTTIYALVSPVTYITDQSPKTISFFGGRDPLIPVSQASILDDKLDAAGVFNKYYMYPNEGHGFTNANNTAHFYKKVAWFFKSYL